MKRFAFFIGVCILTLSIIAFVIINNQGQQGIIHDNETVFKSLSQKEQFSYLDSLVGENGVEEAWKFVVETYTSANATDPGRNAHDLAHFIGIRIYEHKGLSGITICTPSFAFGCYHGFTDAALSKSLEPLAGLADACEQVGPANSGPWASCIHGLGHGVGTYFNTTQLTDALSTCDRLTTGNTYCHDGVFMEFATNAPRTVYEKTKRDPLYPCNSIDNHYRQACARQQPVVLEKYFGKSFGQIVNACLDSSDQTIRYFCIDALGLLAGQRSNSNPNNITQTCATIPDQTSYAQCVSAAAGELVFQNMAGWQSQAPAVCDSLSQQYRQTCHNRVQQVIASYKR